ncbi:MAG: Hsp20/alpha crystallin family protein [Solirubrobacterales bacterium]
MPGPKPPQLPAANELRERLQDAVDRWWASPWGWSPATTGTSGWAPAIDVERRDGSLAVLADVPGIRRDDVKIHVEDDVLTISGETEEHDEETGRTYLNRERRYGSFSRSMALPGGVDPSKIEAKIENGVVEVTIPLADEQSARKRAVTITPSAD